MKINRLFSPPPALRATPAGTEPGRIVGSAVEFASDVNVTGLE